jgi:hypothetical protein
VPDQPVTAASTAEQLAEQAIELAASGERPDASAEELLRVADGDRATVEAARNLLAARLHASVGDWSATAGLSLLNRALATMPRHDPMDWRVMWGQRFRRP